MNRSIVGLSILVLAMGLPLWLYPKDPYHRFGFILTLAGTITLIVSLAIPKKSALKKNAHMKKLSMFNTQLSAVTKVVLRPKT